MKTTKRLDPRLRGVTKEAAEWRLLSLLFSCPEGDWRKHVKALMREVSDPGLKSAARHALKEAGEGLFHHTFGPGGPAPAREASYHHTVQLGYLMSDLEAYYNAFAFTPATAEPADHVSVETAFVAYLRLKQAYALSCCDEERAVVTAESADRFLREHLANIAQDLAARLDESGIPYLAKAGESLMRRVGPPPRTASVLPILNEGQPATGCGWESDSDECGSLP